MRTPYVVVVCGPCGRRGRFAVARLIEKYGNTPMPDLLPVLAKCPKWKSRAHYGGPEATGSSCEHEIAFTAEAKVSAQSAHRH
jgi:hypothetical protein